MDNEYERTYRNQDGFLGGEEITEVIDRLEQYFGIKESNETEKPKENQDNTDLGQLGI